MNSPKPCKFCGMRYGHWTAYCPGAPKVTVVTGKWQREKTK